MVEWKKWIGKDVIVTLKDGNEKYGVLEEPVIHRHSSAPPEEFRLLNGIFVTYVKTSDIVSIKASF